MKTRAMLLNGECTHREYYSQLVTPYIIYLVKSHFGVDLLVNSTNCHFNDIQLNKWDMLANFINPNFKELGDSNSLSGRVCVLKEAAIQIVESIDF